MTKAVKETVQKRIEECRDQLEAPSDDKYVIFVQGMAKAYRDLLDIEPEIELADIEEAA